MPLSYLSSLQHNASCYLTPPSIPDHARSAIFAAAQEQQGHHVKVSSASKTQSSLAVAPIRGKKSHPSKRSWTMESQAPLTKAEEHVLCSDVQDLLFLESKRVELNKVLGRISTEQELAEFVGCTVFRLYARIAKGRAAKRKMIAANLPLVGSLAKEFHGRGLSYNELCQEGALGLVKSTEKFDVSYNTKFSTYAYFWIRERMLSATQNFQQIWRVGGSIRKTVTFILQSKDHFRQQHGRNPSMAELAAFSNTDKLKIKQAFSAIRPGRRSGQGVYKYYNGLSKEPEACGSDLPWPVLWQSEVKDELKSLICGLTPRESQVLTMKYGLHGGSPSSLVQIAANLGVSHEAVRMFEIKALKKLKRSAEETGLKQYLWKMENSKVE